MVKNINKIINNINYKKIFLIAILVCLANSFIFLSFRKLETENLDKVKKSMAALLRNEVQIANSYAISKTISDLESLDLFKCISIKEKGFFERSFYNSEGRLGCSANLLNRAGKFTMTGLNGLKYEFNFLYRLNPFALVVELMIYFLSIISVLLIIIFIRNTKKRNAAMLSELVREKELIVGRNRQVTHDIASPLTVFKTIASLLSGKVDVEIEAVFKNAIVRTELIFKDLIEIENSKELTNITNCFHEIIGEKKFSWNEKVIITIDLPENLMVIANSVLLKRIISNLLNNSYEAFYLNSQRTDTLRITVNCFIDDTTCTFKVVDNGPGIPVSILSKIGTPGFTHGKVELNNSGKGIGLSSAIKQIESWGGKLSFGNNTMNGVYVTFSLNKTY